MRKETLVECEDTLQKARLLDAPSGPKILWVPSFRPILMQSITLQPPRVHAKSNRFLQKGDGTARRLCMCAKQAGLSDH